MWHPPAVDAREEARRRFAVWSAVLAFLGGSACGSAGSTGPASVASPSASGKWVVAYYTSYHADRYPPERVDWGGLTHLVVTRVHAARGGPAGSLVLELDDSLTRELVRRAHENGRQALLMLGGQGNGPIRAACADLSRPDFVRNLLDVVDRYGFDGLDLDWEEDVDYDLFVRLVDDLRSARPGLVLTAPGGVVNPNIETVHPGAARVAQRVDLYSLMSYHPATAMAGWGWLSWHTSPLGGQKPTTPISIEDSLQRHVDAGVPRARLGLGMAFYAICYTGGITGPDQPTQGARIVGGDNDFALDELFSVGGDHAQAPESSRRWDERALVPYLSLPTENRRGCRYVSFDDERSILEKGRFVRANGYGGAIVWNVNLGYLHDPPPGTSPHALTQALRRGFLDP